MVHSIVHPLAVGFRVASNERKYVELELEPEPPDFAVLL
jgi:hypothetical protein